MMKHSELQRLLDNERNEFENKRIRFEAEERMIESKINALTTELTNFRKTGSPGQYTQFNLNNDKEKMEEELRFSLYQEEQRLAEVKERKRDAEIYARDRIGELQRTISNEIRNKRVHSLIDPTYFW